MKNNFSEKSYINKIAMTGHMAIDIVLLLAYALELVKGARTVSYYLVFSLFCIVPIVAERILFRSNPEDDRIKFIVSFGYGILYVFVLFTSPEALACTYIFPMLMLIIMYMDMKFTMTLFGIALLANIANIGWQAITVGYASTEIAGLEIRIAAMVISGIFMGMATQAIKVVNQVKMQQIEEHTNKADATNAKILETSGSMMGDIATVTGKMEELGESMEQIRGYMGEVSTGSNETAESVQQQMERTAAIQKHIARVKSAASGIEKNMKETAERVESGRTQMNELSEQVDKSMSANNQVLDRMKELAGYATQMNTIIETITSIANSTGMLALNASIEAARAGEAGRGFAVVAGQISTLANQTKTATVNITGLIHDITGEIKEVEEAVAVVTVSNEANTESTKLVKENFVGITDATDEIEMQTKELMVILSELEAANDEIVESIQTISAITEEVSAHASETYNACELNAQMVTDIVGNVKDLNENAAKLQAIE